jgi:hypothetical protein
MAEGQLEAALACQQQALASACPGASGLDAQPPAW